MAEALGGWWEERVCAASPAAGSPASAATRRPGCHGAVWRRLTTALPEARFLAWTAGVPAPDLPALAGAGFAAVFDSLGWWDVEGSWLVEEAARLAAIAPIISTVEAPFGPRLAARDADAWTAERAARRHLGLAAGIGAGLLVPMGFEYGARRPLDPARDRPGDWDWLRRQASFDLSDALRAANAAMAARPLARAELRPLSGPGAPVAALLRAAGPDAREAQAATLVLANPDLRRGTSVALATLLPGTGGAFTRFRPHAPAGAPALGPTATVQLDPGEVRLFEAEAPRPILLPAELAAPRERGAVPEESVLAAAAAPRIGIESISPAVDEGRFPVKRIVGEVVEVTCDLICDGHDKLGAALLWRAADEAEWTECRMAPLGNDRWMARFPLERIGRYVFAVEILARRLRHLPRRAGEEARRQRADRAGAGGRPHPGRPTGKRAGRRGLRPGGAAAGRGGCRAADAAALAANRGADGRGRRPPLPRPQRRDAAGGRAHRRRLRQLVRAVPALARAAIPTGTAPSTTSSAACRTSAAWASTCSISRRSTRSAAPTARAATTRLTPAPDDPGSPYAIGCGGGRPRRHPPGARHARGFPPAGRGGAASTGSRWRWISPSNARPTIPGCKRAPGVVRLAAGRLASSTPRTRRRSTRTSSTSISTARARCPRCGWRCATWCCSGSSRACGLFRVDNPHTKPLPFWEWLIAEIRAAIPDAIFLAEAFTRPKMM